MGVAGWVPQVWGRQYQRLVVPMNGLISVTLPRQVPGLERGRVAARKEGLDERLLR